ncbi:hypothetical protein HDV57DRAFT_491451 [Trichoderma longibrachiatum]|uniref:Uncharacterized protein n=1 Tax=Trichoderma longibrachiatum ATCC 18648 TaxID=983965 RepID=A0A2T4C1Y5_TRILO|nr:hypothetical protein M440DRAFT_1257035 [Trichoderma longibrachiatum ATCC 18648]
MYFPRIGIQYQYSSASSRAVVSRLSSSLQFSSPPPSPPPPITHANARFHPPPPHLVQTSTSLHMHQPTQDLCHGIQPPRRSRISSHPRNRQIQPRGTRRERNAFFLFQRHTYLRPFLTSEVGGCPTSETLS